MNNRVLTYCMMTAVGLFGVVVWIALLWAVLVPMRAAGHWGDVTTIAVFAAAHGLLGLLMCLLAYGVIRRLARVFAREDQAARLAPGKPRRRARGRWLGLVVVAALAAYCGYDIARNLAEGTISICGRQMPCEAIERARAPAAFHGAIAFESFFAVFLLTVLVIGAAMVFNDRKRAAAAAAVVARG